MKIGINQFCWPMDRSLKDVLHSSAELGFDSFEVCFTAADGASGGGVTDALGISRYHNPLLNMHSTDEDVRALGRMAQDCGITIGSIGGIVSFSIYPLTAEDEATAQKSEYALKKMLDAARILGASTVLVIPGMLTAGMDYRRAYDLVQGRLAKLADYAPEINLALENVWNNFLYSPLELKRFVEETGRKNLGVYFDVANALRFGYPQQWIRTLGRLIKQVHLKDYRLSIDNINAFTNLLDGDVDYPEVVCALADVGFDGAAVVELVPPVRFLVEESLKYARQTAEKLFSARFQRCGASAKSTSQRQK